MAQGYDGPGPDDLLYDGMYDEFDDLANAVSSLTEDELHGIPSALNAADAWDVDGGGGFLADVSPSKFF